MAEEYVSVAQADELSPGRVMVIEIEDYRIALCNVDGSLYAIDDVCTHDGGPLDQGRLAGDEIECPRHGARFNVRTGEVASMPAVIPVATYPVVVEDGNVLIGLPE